MTPPCYGFYRAKVVSNKDPEKKGRILVWIPDVMPEVSDDTGLFARPANNPIGGRNIQGESDHYYSGSCYIPLVGSWVWIFFENGNISRPYYFGALDLENTNVLPENQLGENYEKKWTIFKSSQGRTIVISDDPDDCRVEITGKKRLLNDPPTGDTNSVYQIDENQTTLLLDERLGKEKLLIRTYKGDVIDFDIENQKLEVQVKNGIDFVSAGPINISSRDDINIKSKTKINIEAKEKINLKSLGTIVMESLRDFLIKSTIGKITRKTNGDINDVSSMSINTSALMSQNRKAGLNISDEATGMIGHKTAGVIANDGSAIMDQSGAALPAMPTTEVDINCEDAASATCDGGRD